MAVQILELIARLIAGLEPQVDCPRSLCAVWHSCQLYSAGIVLPSTVSIMHNGKLLIKLLVETCGPAGIILNGDWACSAQACIHFPAGW